MLAPSEIHQLNARYLRVECTAGNSHSFSCSGPMFSRDEKSLDTYYPPPHYTANNSVHLLIANYSALRITYNVLQVPTNLIYFTTN